MADLINDFKCNDAVKNTGFNGCAVDPGLIEGFIIAPKAMRLTQANLAALKTTLQGLTLTISSNRIYPVGAIDSVTDNSEAAVTETTGYGTPITIREGKNTWMLRHYNGVFYNNKIRSFNKSKKYGVYLFGQGKFYGAWAMNNAGTERELAPFSLTEIFTNAWKVSTGANSVVYETKLAFADILEMNENLGVIKIDFDPNNDVPGILDLKLVSVGTAASKHAYIGVETVEDQYNIYPDYNGELDALAVWTVTDSTGAAVTPSSVTADAVKQGFDFLFSSAGTYTFNLVSPVLLAAAGIGGAPEVGYECTETITVIVPT